MRSEIDLTEERPELRAALEHLGDRERDALHRLPGTRSALEHLGDRERDALHRIREIDLRADDELAAAAAAAIP